MFTLNMQARIRKQTYENRASHTSPKVDNSTTDTKEDNTMKIVRGKIIGGEITFSQFSEGTGRIIEMPKILSKNKIQLKYS